MYKKLIFNTAKESFRRLYRKHKSQVRRAKKDAKRGIKGVGIEPYGLKKRALKKSIRSTKFMTKADYLKLPKAKSLPRGGRPQIFGKAYASDKRGKGLQINPLSKKDRQKIQDEISQSVRRFLKRKKDEPISLRGGGRSQRKKDKFI